VSREAQWRKAKEWRSHVMTFPSLLADTARLRKKKVFRPFGVKKRDKILLFSLLHRIKTELWILSVLGPDPETIKMFRNAS
jgi:hypothetical protein